MGMLSTGMNRANSPIPPKKQGADRRWSERTGKLVEEVMFANDERNGLKREFNDRTGKVLSALPYVDGDKEGTEEAYDEDGINTSVVTTTMKSFQSYMRRLTSPIRQSRVTALRNII